MSMSTIDSAPIYAQLMMIVTTLRGTVSTLGETVSTLQSTIGTLESRLLGWRVMHVTLESCRFIIRTSLTRFPAQSVRSSNADALNSPYLLVLLTKTSQSKQHDKSESVSYYLTD
ncbi:hypothetical protein Tco_0637935 [Tanacetum coccineum]